MSQFDPERMVVLIVDDSFNMRRSMKNMLRHIGFTKFIDAADGDTAWKILADRKVDFIICDWNMPRLPGLELLRRVRDNPSLRDIPFLMMTAEVSESRIVQAAETEVDGYIIKPFVARTLEAKIKRVLKQKETPSEFDAHMKEGQNLLEESDFDGAKREFAEALRLRPESARARQALGEVFTRMGDLREAERWLHEAARANPQYIRVYESLGGLYEKMGRADSALEYLEKACQISPHNSDRQKKLGRLYLEAGEPEKADHAFQMALQSDRGNADLHTEIGEIYLATGDSTKAAAAFKSSLNILEDVHVYNRLGIALRKKGRFAEAIREYKKALKIAPGDEALYYNIGRAYLESGDADNAVKSLTHALRLDPDFAECKELLDRVRRMEEQRAGGQVER